MLVNVLAKLVFSVISHCFRTAGLISCCVIYNLCAGDSRCFLFSVFPTLRVYSTTGYNEHFMYLNHNQQTMPNGLVRQLHPLWQGCPVLQGGKSSPGFLPNRGDFHLGGQKTRQDCRPQGLGLDTPGLWCGVFIVIKSSIYGFKGSVVYLKYVR